MGIRILEAVPRELFDWITSLTEAVPSRSVVTFIELLIGGMLSSRGFVGDAFQMLTMRRKWTGYQKWLETGVCQASCPKYSCSKLSFLLLGAYLFECISIYTTSI